METIEPNARRNFLLAAGLGAAAVAAVAATPRLTSEDSAPAEPAARQTGYRASAHILKYYKTAQV